MPTRKEHPALLAYAFGFFLVLTVVSYFLLVRDEAPMIPSVSDTDYQLPSYQNLFSPR